MSGNPRPARLLFLSAGPESTDKIAVREALWGFVGVAFELGIEIHTRFHPAISPLLCSMWSNVRPEPAMKIFLPTDLTDHPVSGGMVDRSGLLTGTRLDLGPSGPDYKAALFIGGGPELRADWDELRREFPEVVPLPIASTRGDCDRLLADSRLGLRFSLGPDKPDLTDMLASERVYDHLARVLFRRIYAS